ncbi:MAG TPA: GNAT family N-acetyltransferase [Anaerolineae bacterium]|jgi:GNAT superfamily N-acetyltransferase|nr:GNAT family N-acetyltransferase [Anaerolineae bacterium]
MDKRRLFWANTNYFETWRLIIEGSDQSEIHEFDGFLLTDCGQPFAFMNLAFVQRPLTMAEESLDRVIDHYKARNLPAIICIPPGVDDATESLVVRRKYNPATPHPGMTLFPLPPAPEKPVDLEIRSVASDEELALFQATAEAGFNMPFSMPQRLLSRRFRDHPAVSMFIGYVGNMPVCTSCLVTTGPVAGVYWVSTLFDYRGRGYATAISWHAIRTGEALGCDMSTLQASVMGRPIYEKMGFEVTTDFRRYEIIPEG